MEGQTLHPQNDATDGDRAEGERHPELDGTCEVHALIIAEGGRQDGRHSVVVHTLADFDRAVHDLVDQTMLVVDPARLPSREIVLQRLRVTHALVGRPHDLFEQGVDPPERLGVPSLPLVVLFSSALREAELHSAIASSLSIVL